MAKNLHLSPDFLTEVTAIWGCRNSGKSYLARKVLEQAAPARALIIDPVSAEGCTTKSQVVAFLESGQPRVVMRNPARSEILECIYAAYLASTKANPVFIVCDEAPAYLDKPTEGLNTIIFRGRHRGCGMLMLGQRPTAVDAGIRSQAAATYWLKLTDFRDIQVAGQTIGPDRARDLANLAQGEFIRHPE